MNILININPINMELRTSNAPLEFSPAWCDLLRKHVIKLIGDGLQKDLAFKIGVSQAHLSLLINKRLVSSKVLKQIATGTDFLRGKQEKAVEFDNTMQRERMPSSGPACKPSKPSIDQDPKADIEAVEKYLYCRKSVDNLIPELKPRMLAILIDDLTSDLSKIDVQELC